MKFIDEATRDDLAKSSTLLQCVLSIVDFECSKSHFQAELIGVEDNEAMLNVDALPLERVIEICTTVNKQFMRKDGELTCLPTRDTEGFISCFATVPSDYVQLT